MGVLRFDPFRGFDSVTRRMNEVMKDVEKGFSIETGEFNPRVDIIDGERELIINAELAGMRREDVKISINDDKILTLKGNKSRNNNDDDKLHFIRTERSFGGFLRSFVLPDGADIEKVSAKFDSGVLSISIAKKEPEMPKEYSINID